MGTLHFNDLLLILCTYHRFATHEHMLCDHLRLLIACSLAVVFSAPKRFLLYPFLLLNMTWNNSEKGLWPQGDPLAAARVCDKQQVLLGLAADKLVTVGWKEQRGTWGVGRKEQGRVPRENCLVWQLE